MSVYRIYHSVDSGCAVSDVRAYSCDAAVIPKQGRMFMTGEIRQSPENAGRQLRDWGKPNPRPSTIFLSHFSPSSPCMGWARSRSPTCQCHMRVTSPNGASRKGARGLAGGDFSWHRPTMPTQWAPDKKQKSRPMNPQGSRGDAQTSREFPNKSQRCPGGHMGPPSAPPWKLRRNVRMHRTGCRRFPDWTLNPSL